MSILFSKAVLMFSAKYFSKAFFQNIFIKRIFNSSHIDDVIKCKPVQTAELQPPHVCDLCEVCSWACHSNLGQCEYWWQGTAEGSLPCIVLFGNARLQRISITQLSMILKAKSHLLLLVLLALRGTGNK